MKPLLLALLISLSTNAQSIEAKLKAKVLQIEIEKMSKSEFERVRLQPDVQFASFQYRLMPIKLKWDEFYNAIITYRGQMRLVDAYQTYDQLFKQARLHGTQKVNALIDSLGVVWIREEREKTPKEAYLKAKYGNADPDRLIYEVTYELKYNREGQNIQGNTKKMDFYQNDLSEVHFQN